MQLSIGKQWKELLDYNDTIGFIFHDDAKKLGRAAKKRYTTQKIRPVSSTSNTKAQSG
ncbi:hypothetical protein J1N35_033074 [Gossypium stocksii]|uniref:Uncharacterized protein n=1 Tax=Gossypium stocksii TaxID=47602 RepID=A0A9D3URB9_9ROSI|nr:hypothetical protein J1N35_033074 [Gossypium stocksii]